MFTLGNVCTERWCDRVWWESGLGLGLIWCGIGWYCLTVGGGGGWWIIGFGVVGW